MTRVQTTVTEVGNEALSEVEGFTSRAPHCIGTVTRSSGDICWVTHDNTSAEAPYLFDELMPLFIDF